MADALGPALLESELTGWGLEPAADSIGSVSVQTIEAAAPQSTYAARPPALIYRHDTVAGFRIRAPKLSTKAS